MRARKVDMNHNAIADAFRSMGWHVHSTIGDWDLTIQKSWITLLIEVKRGPKAKHTPKQLAMLEQGWQIDRVETLDDVEHLTKWATETIKRLG